MESVDLPRRRVGPRPLRPQRPRRPRPRYTRAAAPLAEALPQAGADHGVAREGKTEFLVQRLRDLGARQIAFPVRLQRGAHVVGLPRRRHTGTPAPNWPMLKRPACAGAKQTTPHAHTAQASAWLSSVTSKR